MADPRIDVSVDHQRNDRHPTPVRRVDDVPSRVTGDAAVRIGVVPGWAEHVDLVPVREERGPAIIRVHVIHLHHPARNHLGQRGRDGQVRAECRTAQGPIGGLDTWLDHDRSAVR